MEVAQAGAVRHGALPVELSAFAGAYADSLYGEATVTLDGDHLVMKRGDWQGTLEFANALNFTWKLPPGTPVPSLPIRFEASPDGKVTGMYFGLGSDATLLGRKSAGGGRGGRR